MSAVELGLAVGLGGLACLLLALLVHLVSRDRHYRDWFIGFGALAVAVGCVLIIIGGAS